MGLDSLNKNSSGAALIENFKDIFPNKLQEMYIYEGVNLVSKGNEVFSREDTVTYISLRQIGVVDVIYGGQALTSTIRTITESKTVKETARQKISTDSVTTFFRDLGNVDLTKHNLFYTIGKPFVQSNLEDDQLEVLSDAQIAPNLLEKLLSGVSPLNVAQKNLITNNKTASFTLTPAVLDDTLPASTVRFVDSTIYKPIPSEEVDFEITSIDLTSDQTLALEYQNGIKARGIIEDQIGNLIENDLDFKMDKPLMPLQINPYAKNSNIQFAIENFNYYQRMPYLSAKHFLGNDRSIVSFIKGTTTDQWAIDLATAVVDMFVMSWAISTGFATYRDTSGEISNELIGGVSIKAMEGKKPDELSSYVDQILRNWEYKNNVKNKDTDVYKRALQVLAASSEIIESSYCIGKGLTQFHKSIFDFWLNLNTVISKNTTDINMTLTSDKYVFTYEQDSSGDKDLDKPIINLKPYLNISKNNVTNYGRLTSLAELDDPISITGFTTFAGDVDPKKADSTKYFVGIDITDPTKIAEFLGNVGEDLPVNHVVNKEFDSPWYVMDYIREGSPPPNPNTPVRYNLVEGQQYEQQDITMSGKNFFMLGKKEIDAPTLTDQERNDLIRKSLSIPANATNVTISYDNIQKVDAKISVYYKSEFNSPKEHFTTNMIRYTGTVVTYTVKATTHGVTNRKQTYDKPEFLNMILQYAATDVWKRTLTLSDNWRDINGVQTSKIKSINHLFLSTFLGNYLDIILNYKYKDDQGNEQTGSTKLPRIKLPASDDERRTKLGIRL